MKIIILTTETPHHLYFVKEISNLFKISAICVERLSLKPSFETFHPFEKDRDEYEKDSLLNGQNIDFKDYSTSLVFDNINDIESVNYIEKVNPDVIITYGTGIIRKRLINLCKNGIVNLHGGDPQNYRGLDSHLWAIYHNDFKELIVTLHKLNLRLDDGEIINKTRLKINRNSKLYMIRAEVAKICVDLILDALNIYEKNGSFISTPQLKIGRYYSFMPSVLKEISLNNFNKHVNTL